MIGQKKTSKCTICTNTSCLIPITFQARTQYAAKVVVVTPFYGTMLPNGDMNLVNKIVGNPSAYHDFGFRRILTMFTQLRCKGMYLTVTPMITAADMDFITIWSCWERKAKQNDWDMYGDPTTITASRKIREAAELQGKKGAVLNVQKGFFSYKTKCTPIGTEKTGWMDADTFVGEEATTTKTYNVFRLKRPYNATGAQTYIEFNPMCFIAFEAPLAVTVDTTILFRFDLKCYIQLRYPGCTMDDTTLEKLLKTNAQLIPWTPTKTDKTTKMEDDDDDDPKETQPLLDEDTQM